MRIRLYHLLVNSHAGIRQRYHAYHDRQKTAAGRLSSWLYLLWLNLCYYIFRQKDLDLPPEAAYYEEKEVPVEISESEASARALPGKEEILQKVMAADLVSFDIFDTLIFRPFSAPTDLFRLFGTAFGIMDFPRIRAEMEYTARLDHYKTYGNYEVSFEEIWDRIEKQVGVPAKEGMAAETALEMEMCFANPFMKEIFDKAVAAGKRVVITSDMYLPKAFLEQILAKNGFTGYERFFLSNVYGKSKSDGSLYDLVKEETGMTEGQALLHIGDNEASDIRQAQKHGFQTIHYPNVNKAGAAARAQDMSVTIGGAYRGIVNNHLYNGSQLYSQDYEYGFVYGGLFVTGYCAFIHRWARAHRPCRLVFLSRDGDILKEVYDRMYPEDDTVYAYWSRNVSTRLMAVYNRYDYIRRMLYHKVNTGKDLRQVLTEAGLKDLLKTWEETEEKQKLPALDTAFGVRESEAARDFLLEHWDQVTDAYKEELDLAGSYYRQLLSGADTAAFIDIGWAGSGAVSLACLADRAWKIPCRITGIIAGTNTIHNAEPDASEPWLVSGKLEAYLYSQQFNRDLLKKHDPGKDYNLYWELLLSSPTRQCTGFQEEDGRAVPVFGKADKNPEGIARIRAGILDFNMLYMRFFGSHPEMLTISGRDAYAPILAAAGRKDRYLKHIYQDFYLEKGI